MDKSAIKNFAVGARVKLIEQIEQKAYNFGITNNEIKEVEVFEDTFEVNGNKYNKSLLKYRQSLEEKISYNGFDQIIEEAAYTWFNRLIAIRFMEVNEYLPSGIRVLSSTDSSNAEPDIIREAANLEFENLDIDLVYKLQDENNTEELFKYLLIKQCNELGKIMPVIFEEIEDFTELLLPDNLLQEGSIIRDLVTSINEEDWKKQVEIIGWLYQYYISEKKDEVFADLKKNVKIIKENIPAATQLFTPDWIVKYMVQNSLGRLWLESHPDEELKAKWKYYLEEAKQESEVHKQLVEIREKSRDLKPEDIKVIDPCMGSGHILVYQFEVLYDIYKSAGYSEREIPKLILTKNLYGLDIDDRAAQLAYFAVMMKARSYNRRIFREKVDLNICSIQESNDLPKEAIDFLVSSRDTEIEKKIHRDDVEYLINVFDDAKEYGSILEVKEIDFDIIERRVEEIRKDDITDIFELQFKNVILDKIPILIKQARLISKKYDIVVTNPPYMGHRGMNDKLSNHIKNNFPDAKTDFFAVYIEKSKEMCKSNGFYSLITQPSWLFLSTFTRLREKLINNSSISSLLHMGRGIFGIDFGSTAFVLQNCKIEGYRGSYFRLHKRVFQYIALNDIRQLFMNAKNDKNYSYDFDTYKNDIGIEKEIYHSEKINIQKQMKVYYEYVQGDFKFITGFPIAYWVSDRIRQIFSQSKPLGVIAEPRQGMATADNNRFLRLWYEVNYYKIGFNISSSEQAKCSKLKWFPYNKGGDFRKWYGNNEYVVNWENDGMELKNYKPAVIRNPGYYFRKGITWSFVSSKDFGARFFPSGFIFDVGGSSVFPREEDLYYINAFLCSKLTMEFLKIQNPTINFQVGNIANLPIILEKSVVLKDKINKLTQQCIRISKNDWDAFETSWEFSKHPLLKFNRGTLKSAFSNWESYISNQRIELKKNEEELNKKFISIYELENELEPVISESNITISVFDKIREVKSLFSYAVGCMMGRYSLDEEGLIYAGGDFNIDRYKIFKADVDNVIPITDDEYFEDDIVSRFVEFIKTIFSEETLEENLDYIADTLVKRGNETSRQTIRRYFLKDFYRDHLKIYQKRPIYWLFDSGKNDGFKALIYMHRYDIGTVARVRTEYLHLLQRKYEVEVNTLDIVMENSNASLREKTEARKKKEKIQRQILECIQYDQVIAHVANQKINIDLDDGVKINYAKFQWIKVPQGEGKKILKTDLLFTI